MQFLFLHNNFPGQFRHIASHLATRPEHRVAAIGSQTAQPVRGVALHKYGQPDIDVSGAHPFARRFDVDCRRAEQVLYAATALRERGFHPHIVVAHAGWGEALPLRDLFPNARIVIYGEYYYRIDGQDMGFDPDFPTPGIDGAIALRAKNAATLVSLIDSDAAITPTLWQRSTFPHELQSKFTVLHEGVRTDLATPSRADDVIALPDGRQLSRANEVVTFVARDLEPLRGVHILARAIPIIQRRRPEAQILIVGGDGVSYGVRPPSGKTWREHHFGQRGSDIDMHRVHFLGRLPYNRYLTVLRASTAHVYLTYPFVLSWSLLEAMSSGCAVVASDTGPLHEVIDRSNGLLVPFFDYEALADTVVRILKAPHAYDGMREKARATVLQRFSTQTTVPAWTSFLTR